MPRRGSHRFEHLLSPGRLGPLTLRNRILMPAMDMNLCEDGVITEAELAHYRRRAAGGTAMVITGSGAVAFPVGAASREQPGLSEDRFVPGLRRLADAVHDAGSLLCIQLCHHGKSARVDIAEGRPVLVPSLPRHRADLSCLADNTPTELAALAAATAGRTPEHREASEDDLAWLIDQFAEAARRASDAGADAVEIHAAHGYVLSAFLSPADNQRTDRWGGSLENRCRLTEAVLAAVRAAIRDDMALLVRVNGQEYGEPGGLTTEDAVAAARRFEAAGADAIHVSGYGRNPFADFTEGPLPDQPGAYRRQIAAVARAVSVPVIGVGRVLPELAEELVASGDCTFVSMGRQLLADPDLAGKLASGRADEIRPCINCYVCVEQNFFDATPRCAVNPALGHEDAEGEVAASGPGGERVVVVGGGPAGLEYARLAAGRGDRVTVLERSGRLGGTAWFSQLTTPANGPFVAWQARQLGALGVDVRLRTEASVESIRALAPDRVVVATGAARGRPDLPGASLAHVLTGDDLRRLIAGDAVPGQPRWRQLALRLADRLSLTSDPDRLRRLSRRYLPLGRQVVILGGGLVGLELAIFLAERGRSVTVLEASSTMGVPMASPRRWTAVRHAADLGVTIHRSADVVAIDPRAVTYRRDGVEERASADTVVVASYVTPSGSLAHALREGGMRVDVLGDAAEVGYLEGAVNGAWALARSDARSRLPSRAGEG